MDTSAYPEKPLEISARRMNRLPLTRRVGRAVQTHPLRFLPIWLLCYFAAILPSAFRPLWYDELLTYYGATATSLSRFLLGITHFDFNPPLQYGLVRLGVAVFGDSPLAIRLPSMAAFCGAGLVLFLYERRRAGGGYALTVLGLIFASGFLNYSTEARPYALELLFVSIAFTSWLLAIERDTWGWAHSALTLAVAGLFLTHCFAPVFVLPIACGELVRSIAARRSDWRILAALGIPVPLAALYIPFIQKPGQGLYPFPANWGTFYEVYGLLLLPFVVPFALLLAAGLFPRQGNANAPAPAFAAHEAMLLATGLAAPALVILYAIHAEIPFAQRYVIGFAVPVSLLAVRLFERLALKSASAGALGAILILVNFAPHNLSPIPMPPGNVDKAADLSGPIVLANGARFLELDYYASPKFVKQLFYLTDRDAAIRYSRLTIFEEFGLLKAAYPVRGTVLRYSDFISAHKRFRVISFPGEAQWLLPKLRNDGAQIARAQEAPWLFEVAMP